MINKSDEKILGMIGLCKRAGKLITGEQAVLESLRNSSSALIIISSDASAGTVKKITDKCKNYKKDYIVFSDRYTLGKYTKKEYAVSVSVNDMNFAKKILELYSDNSLI